VEGFADVALDIVLSPALWLSVLFGLIYGALFTLWRGGGIRQGLRDIVAGLLGFGAGQIIATLLPLPSLQVGEAHLLWGSVFAVLCLLLGRRIWRPRVSPPADTTRSAAL
jgi:hypothetical protein